jgi:hypothetical protein
MNKKTKKILAFSTTLMIISASGLGFLLYKIKDKGNLLNENVKTLTENSAKESSYLELNKLVNETEKDRDMVASVFLSNEADSISYLSEIETMAAELGLVFKTESLDKVVEKSKEEYVKMSFSYEGKKETVAGFLNLMENAPYHSRVESFSFEEKDPGNWAGRLTLLITVEPK